MDSAAGSWVSSRPVLLLPDQAVHAGAPFVTSLRSHAPPLPPHSTRCTRVQGPASTPSAGSWIPPSQGGVSGHWCVCVKTKPLEAKPVGAGALSQCGSSRSRGPRAITRASLRSERCFPPRALAENRRHAQMVNRLPRHGKEPTTIRNTHSWKNPRTRTARASPQPAEERLQHHHSGRHTRC